MSVIDFAKWMLRASAYLGFTMLTGGLLMLYTYQNSLIYPANFPPGSREKVATPAMFDMHDYEDIQITTPDGVVITAYLIRRRLEEGEQEEGMRRRVGGEVEKEDERPLAGTTLIYCHANAGNMGDRLPIARIFYRSCKCNVVMFSYRGYGKSGGSPSEPGIRIDAQAVLDWVKADPRLAKSKIVVYGQSLGGAVAIDLAARNQNSVTAVMVENTFLSLPKLIPHVLPYIRHFTFLCSDKWNTEQTIKTIKELPILLLSGGKDELIPAPQMARLCIAARTARGVPPPSSETSLPTTEKNVQFIVFPSGTHNETCMQKGYFQHVFAFWDNFVMGRGSSGEGVTSVPDTVEKADGSLLEAYKTVQQGGEGAGRGTAGLGVPRM
ncbi:Alpha/Beta hydrolase protein [Phlyctochytrium arcticum]|nr:Alpha/Beta hydrolase protein [Phlyctochytrium arcticum]